MKDMQTHWDKLYQLPPDTIPWEIATPPRELIEVIASMPINRGAALDVACGTGNYSKYLARCGFEVTGIDFSETAIKIATKRFGKESAHFKVGDVRHLKQVLGSATFDFILDYSLLHHISGEDVANYAGQFKDLLRPGGKLLLVCYSEADPRANQRASITGEKGNEMYFRSRKEIELLYGALKVQSYELSKLGKRHQHPAHSFVFTSPVS